MSSFTNIKQYKHDQADTTGVLLVNLGTPDAPTPSALRAYLGEFLWDPRVVEIPRLIWWLILHGVILRIRPARSAKAYREIWLDGGSPLLVYTQKQAYALQQRCGNVTVAAAMRYGKPSIRAGLQSLRQAGLKRLLVLPLYPQYSATTTASVFDEVTRQLQSWRYLPEVRFVNHYHDYEPYIQAAADHIRHYWEANGRTGKLLLSFHGIPKRCLLSGDPYYCECHKTARLIAEALGLAIDEWQLVFQSRFGREEWLKPYLDETLRGLPGSGCQRVDVFCPGFSADCLETLEEIAIQNRAVFLGAGGEGFRYIPALNDTESHITALASLIGKHTEGWSCEPQNGQMLGQRKARALMQGAAE